VLVGKNKKPKDREKKGAGKGKTLPIADWGENQVGPQTSCLPRSPLGCSTCSPIAPFP